ncbi:MAG: DUF1080 domain-containing protein [Armatimonadetes bacterium]|nr:DUF1080 domain-containing protein [Armatimonadota bacterium]
MLASCLGLMGVFFATGTSEADGTEAKAPKTGKPAPSRWISLFNGKNLQGWTPKIKGYEAGVNFGNTFRVENGVLKVSYDAYPQFDGRFGHLFYRHAYSHYRLRLQYRFVGEQSPGGPGWALRNSGVMIHGQSPETMSRGQEFPVSIEVQLLGGSGKGERPTANLCTPGTHVVMNGKLFTPHCTNSRSETYHGDSWVNLELEVNGNGVIRHLVNGKPVLEYEKPQLDENDPDARRLIESGKKTDGKIMLREKMIHGGTISLQSESHPVEFRRIELLPLDAPGKKIPVN